MDDSFILANFHTICRLCLKKNNLMMSIYVPDEETSVPLTSKIAECFELQMNPSDGFPGRICYKCLFRLEECSKFRQQCIQNEIRLKQIISRVNELDISNSSELNNYNHCPQSKIKTDEFSIVEDRVVMVVDPSMDYDTSEDSEGPEQPEPKVTNGDINPDKELVDAYFKNVAMCQFCDQAFVTMEKCKQHENNFHDHNLPYNCLVCGLVFAERSQYIQHTRFVHCNNKPYHCPECEKSFSRRSDLRKHSIVHTGIRPYQCHHCFKTFSRNTNLSKHLRIHSGSKPHVCPLCPRSFVDKSDLEQHVLVHTGHKPYSCRHCPATFSRRDKLVKHEIKHVNSGTQQGSEDGDMVVNVNPFSNILPPNGQMSELTNSNFDLPRVPDHITGENSFHNQIHRHSKTPSKLMKNPAKLKVSMKNKPKNIKCHQCPKRFSSLDAYKTHVSLAHIGSRVFQCRVCFKKFTRKKELDRHSLIHSKNTMLSCSQCEEAFNTKDKLMEHEQTHECIVNNLPCIECGATFEKKDDLVAHIKSHFVDDFNDDETENDIKKEPDIDLPQNETVDTLET